MATTYQCLHCESVVDKKRCSRCKERKPIEDFYARIYKGKRLPDSWCIPCKKLYDGPRTR